MGGGAYVNVMHNLLEMKELESNEKESALVLSLMFNDIGILGSAIFTLVMDNTLFKSQSKWTLKSNKMNEWMNEWMQ